ncbi:mannose-1-phosphate guanylyltransferase [Paenibacillus sp. 1_12]|uniref:sugar phosphate nucleotidyltransferase n=1 Tax=Paenibacillus sp. 1_12 TaxID=1566278 RepID=UPI0008F1A650|nr:sugar phosphate nucleotidyltransferase [Paenibacillus sp. 1_12]SFL64262.1 mannose-1-phosphate guanylyltransferase [Paenibacillus sp. 1_12]
MNIILLSGGSGVRLWPLSSEQRPKQFVPFFKDSSGQPASMLQHVWSQLKHRNLHKSTVIATSVGQQELIREQIGRGVDLVLEPEKRDTFPAILLSVAYLYSHKGISRDEPVAVMSVDSRVDDSFYDALLKLPEALDSTRAHVALLGVKPTFPSQKYGYILPEANTDNSSIMTIKQFYEKPNAQDAALYIERGALWNCGVFCFKVGFLLDLLASMGLPETYEELLLVYSQLESLSFDYAVVEREKNIAAITYTGSWKDMGTWCTLTEELNEPLVGKGVLGSDNSQVHIMNELDIPIVAIGLSNIVIAASKEGILVSQKGSDAQLKDAIHLLKESTLPKSDGMEAHSRLVDRSVFADGTIVTTKKIHLRPGMEQSFEPLTDGRQQIVSWTVMHGSPRVIKNNEDIVVSSGWNVVLENCDKAVIQALGYVDLLEITTITKQ